MKPEVDDEGGTMSDVGIKPDTQTSRQSSEIRAEAPVEPNHRGEKPKFPKGRPFSIRLLFQV